MNRTLFYSFVGLTLSFGFVCAHADKPNGGIKATCSSDAISYASDESQVNTDKGEVNYAEQMSVHAVFPQQQVEDRVYDVVEQQPEFPGGPTARMKWLSDHIMYPVVAVENNIEGRVIVKFIVRKDGSISDVKVVRPVDPSLDKEAVRVVSSMPQWIPGRQNGHMVNVRYFMPVTFKLPNL